MAAVASSHGGDSSGEPPRPPHRSPACDSALPTKKRGVARNKKLLETWKNNNKMPMPLVYDWERTLLPVCKNGGMLTRFIGTSIRSKFVPCYDDWARVPLEQRQRLMRRAHTYFKIRGDLSKPQYMAVIGALDGLMASQYRDFKTEAHDHFLDNAADVPYRNISNEDWLKCIELFSSPKFLARSAANKRNRNKQRYPSLQGSISYSASRYKKRNHETGEWQSLSDCFQEKHTKKGKWVNEQASIDYEHLTKVMETQLTQASAVGATFNDISVAEEALGARRGHVRGVGRMAKGKSKGKVKEPLIYCSADDESSEDPPSRGQSPGPRNEDIYAVLLLLAERQGLAAEEVDRLLRQRQNDAASTSGGPTGP